MKRLIVVGGLWGLLCSGLLGSEVAGSSDALGEPLRGSLSFFGENDIDADKDSNYTNGGHFAWISGEIEKSDFNFVDRGLDKIVGSSGSWQWVQRVAGFEDPSAVRYQRGLSVSQLIFTPREKYSLTPPPGQRPYAGWLGSSYSLNAKGANVFNSVELSFGVIGPLSGAGKLQTWVHKERDITVFEGWDSQMQNEMTVNLYWVNKRRLRMLTGGDDDGISWRTHSDSGLALGTYRTNAYVGFMTRYGWNLSSRVVDPRISESSNNQELFLAERSGGGQWTAYLMLGGRITGVFYDVTLDGPVFSNYDTGIDKEYVTVEGFIGVGFRYKKFDFGFAQTYKSDEFATQVDTTSYASLFMSVSF